VIFWFFPLATPTYLAPSFSLPPKITLIDVQTHSCIHPFPYDFPKLAKIKGNHNQIFLVFNFRGTAGLAKLIKNR